MFGASIAFYARVEKKEFHLLAYFVLFGMFAFAAIAAGTRAPGEYRIVPAISAMILVIAIGLRDRIGCDWQTYQYIFDRIQYQTLLGAISQPETDPAYSFLCWLAGNLGLGLWAVNSACALIFTAGLLRLSRAQPNPPLAILVAIPYLVIVVAMGYTRQSAALGLIMFAIPDLERGAYLRVAITLLVAATFHKSATIAIPFFVIAAARGSLLSVLITIPIAFIAYNLLLSQSLQTLLANYIGTGYSSSGAFIRVLMNVIPATIYIFFARTFQESPEMRLFWRAFSFASVAALVVVLISSSTAAVDRAALYLIPLQVAVLARIPSAFGRSNRQNNLLVLAVIVYSLAVEFVWLNFGQFSECWIPYRNYLW